MLNELFLKRCVSSGSLSLFLSLCLAICLFLFCFVGLFFLRLSLMQILVLVLFSFYHFEGSFHFWALLWGLVLRPFSTCSSLMSFSPFSRFLWLLSLLVASFFFLSFFLFYLLSRGRRRDPFLCVCELFGFFLVWFLKKILGRIQPISFLYWFCSQQFAELGSIHFFAFSARACSLAFCV